MGVEPPFIYDKPSSYTFAGPTNRSFNPRAATQASWTPPAPKVKQEGPLINFNKHPDSYLIVPYGNLNVEPMPPGTKRRVKRARAVQMILRILEFLGGLGLLFSIIAIKGGGWMTRVGPAVVLVHSFYGVYHLRRDAGRRPPASTASYMMFAGLIDAGLLPFFGVSAVMANADYTSNTYGWGTLFTDDVASYKIIYAFFLLCVTEGGMLAVSLCLDFYLAVMFRGIAKMPPDMNPLEDNLTARPNGKRHKRNKSELVFEKHLSDSTLVTQRLSNMSSPSIAGTKRIPFTHTRTDSADSVTLYGNEKALDSRVSLRQAIDESKDDPYRNSVASDHATLVPSRPTSAVKPSANARAPGAGLGHKPQRSSALAQSNVQANGDTWLSYQNREGTPTSLSRTARQELDNEVRPLSPVSMLSEHDVSPSRARTERQNWYQGSNNTSPIRNHESVEYGDTRSGSVSPLPIADQKPKRSRDPLAMNPPTPTPPQFSDENADARYKQSANDRSTTPPLKGYTIGNHQYSPAREVYSTPQQHFATPHRTVLEDVHTNSPSRPGVSSRPVSFVGSGGKSRYYGNLRSSLGGSPTRQSIQDHFEPTEDDYPRTRTMDSDQSGNYVVYSPKFNRSSRETDDNIDSHDQFESLRQQVNAIMQPQSQQNYDRQRQHQDVYIDRGRHNLDSDDDEHDDWNGHRKVSNSTGYDLRTGYAGLGAEFGAGMARRRDVSGKIAEEGRATPSGVGYGGLGRSESKDGGVITGQKKGGAAGWARFHGETSKGISTDELNEWVYY